MIKRTLLIFFSAILPAFHLSGQNWPLPVLPDTSQYGRYTSRTMNLLQSSTPKNQNTVKILVYGQSISAQDWWIQVKESIEKRYPDANLIMENKAIGGFASQMLCKTVEMDVSTFYPDMVLLHIYGSNKMYDSVLHTIRSRTAAEVAIQTDHFTGSNSWSDSMSYHLLPEMAEKYKCDLVNIRDPWKKYLEENNLEAKDLLKDEVHLNKQGEFLMSELIKPLFQYKSKYESDPFGLSTTLLPGKDFKLKKGKLKVSFSGNRVDVVNLESKTPVKSEVLLDGKKPSDFQGTYFITRPYAANGKSWPWSLPAMISVKHATPWITEEWTCRFTDVRPPYENFSFVISGSVTGIDGSGQANHDFISDSKRVIISHGDAELGGDWHLHRSYKVLKTIVNSGDEVKWKSYTISKDVWQPVPGEPSAITLFQGVPNTRHELVLNNEINSVLPLREIRVYRPYYLRTGPESAQSANSKKADKAYNAMYTSLSAKIDRERIRSGVYYLSQDPLPRRVLNYSLPGHEKSTLEEADAWIIQQLTGAGYNPETDETRVRAFGRDHSKPIHHQYATPPDDSPWLIARNIITTIRGTEFPDDMIVIIAHKDSQSWIASPGANDNAIGTCGALELALILNKYKPKHTIRFIFCNEEHTPWTSVTAAEEIKASGVNVLAVINMDGIGVKPPEQKGHLTNVTRYTTPEGERLADMMAELNKLHKIGLEQSKYQSLQPGDDDGSFINAGFPWSVLNIGSMPYGDPEYHLEGDTAEKVDYENAALTVKLTLAALLHLDTYGRP